jgi:ADP-heptose:LPS heptosyltransferase
MKILVNCHGFIGDILFASSIAKKLKEKYGECHITYEIPLPQPKLLLLQNPYIDAVLVEGEVRTLQMRAYDLIVDVPEVDQRYPATMYMQAKAGIEDQSLEFDVWTEPGNDSSVQGLYDIFRENRQLPIVVMQQDWGWRAYQCTPETLAKGIGAPHRDTDRIKSALQSDYNIQMVGWDRTKPSTHPETQDPVMFSIAASMIKKADWFIGAEGGLSNLAAAVGTKCIITTDFIEQNYGKNGRVKQIESPQMGPAVYYPQGGHVHLPATITDDEIITRIREIIK